MEFARGVLNKSLFGEAPPQGPTPYPIYIPFSKKKSTVPLSHPSRFEIIGTLRSNDADDLTTWIYTTSQFLFSSIIQIFPSFAYDVYVITFRRNILFTSHFLLFNLTQA